jgi:transposase
MPLAARRARAQQPRDRKAVGWTQHTVLRVQAEYAERGEAALFARPGRGGRRREVLNERQEKSVLHSVRAACWQDGIIDTRLVHEAVEKMAGHKVPASTVYRMLARHGWHKVPRVIVTKLRHAPEPASQPAGSDAPRSGKPRTPAP